MIKVFCAPIETLTHPSLCEQWEDQVFGAMTKMRKRGFQVSILGTPMATTDSVVMLVSIGKVSTLDIGGQLQQRSEPADPSDIRALLAPKKDGEPRIKKVT